MAEISSAGSLPRSTMEDRGIGVGEEVRPPSVVFGACDDEGEAEALFDSFFEDDDDGVEISAALGDWGFWDADSFDERVDERVDGP